jgi:hypothetical protein
MRCTVASFFQDGWSLSTMNRAPNATMYAWRLPKSVWSSHPDMPLVELWTEHLNRRERMLAVLGVVLVTELSLESYFARQRQILAERKAAINIKSLATIKAEMESFERSPVYEWLGDFSLHDDASKHP